jgi:hypothetical protein
MKYLPRDVAREKLRAMVEGANRSGRALVRVAASLAVLLAFAGPALAGPSKFTIQGKWRGQLHQRGLEPFKVTATIRGLGRSARNPVHYTGINCSGRWTYLGREGASYRFRERITSGRGGSCKGVGTVTLTQAGANRVHYVFHGGGVVSRGLLARAR